MDGWRFSELRSELALHVNGAYADAAEVAAKRAGTSFTLQAGKHFLTFLTDEADSARVTITVNGAERLELAGAVRVSATAAGVAFQQAALLPWPEPAEPRGSPPRLGGWVADALGGSVLSAEGAARPAAAAFARAVRLVGILFSSERSELSRQATRRLVACCAAGLALDVGVVAVAVESTAADADAACASLPAGWAALPYAQTERACARYGLRGVPTLVLVDALSGRVVRTNAVLDVMAHAHEPATVLRLCGLERPTCWARAEAKRRAAASRRGRTAGLAPEALLSAFRAADRDGSGVVSAAELRGALRALELPVSPQTLALFRAHDADGDGALDFFEFCALCGRCRDLLRPRDPERRRLLAAFAEGDEDGLGFLRMGGLLAGLAAAGLRTDASTACRAAGRPLGEGDEVDFPEFVRVHERVRELAAEAAGAGPAL